MKNSRSLQAFALANRLKDPRLLARVVGYRAIHNCFFLRLRDSIADAQASGELIRDDRNPWAEAQRLLAAIRSLPRR